MNHLLELSNVTKEFSGGTVALDDISFSIDADIAKHHLHCRRERQRQVDHGHDDPRAF